LQALEGLQAAGHSVTIYTSSNKEGFLGNVQGEIKSFPYKFFRNPIIRLVAFVGSHLILFLCCGSTELVIDGENGY